MKYVLAIDQSTSATKAVLFAQDGSLVSRSDAAHRQYINDLGWVEHDPEEIYQNTLKASRAAVEAAGISPGDVAAVAISNQRETAVCWDRETGRPVYNAIVWQCARAAEITRRVDMPEVREDVYARTGLQLSPFFSGPKYAWVIEHVPEAAELMQKCRLCCGTIDAWLMFCLSGGKAFKSEYSNASRTLLLNLDTLDWDDEMLSLFGIFRSAMPELCASGARFCETTMGGLFEKPVPVHAALGDSQAALFANGGMAPYRTKATFGTGTSVMMNIGGIRARPRRNVVESIGWKTGEGVSYVLEGNINYTGALIKWLVENMGLLESSKQSGRIASEVPDNGGVYIVPAFTGLGAPYWLDDARALICGMSPATRRAHIVRAAEEAIAYQIRDVMEELLPYCGGNLPVLYADGGAKNDAFLMQFVSDMLGVPVRASGIEELSAAGAAYMAMLETGLAGNELFSREAGGEYQPRMDEETRRRNYHGWKQAVNMLLKR